MPITASSRVSSITPRAARSGSVAVSRITSCDAEPPAVSRAVAGASATDPSASIAARSAASPIGWNLPDSGSARPTRVGSPGPTRCPDSSKPSARRALALSRFDERRARGVVLAAQVDRCLRAEHRARQATLPRRAERAPGRLAGKLGRQLFGAHARKGPLGLARAAEVPVPQRDRARGIAGRGVGLRHGAVKLERGVVSRGARCRGGLRQEWQQQLLGARGLAQPKLGQPEVVSAPSCPAWGRRSADRAASWPPQRRLAPAPGARAEDPRMVARDRRGAG